MNERARERTRLRPLLCLLAPAVVLGDLIARLHQTRAQQGAEELVFFSLGALASELGPPALLLLLVGSLAAVAVAGGGGVRAALAFALGRAGTRDAERAQAALLAAARATTGFALVTGLFGSLFLFALLGGGPGREPAPAALSSVLSWTAVTPLLGLLLGRLVLGALADGAAAAAGRPGRVGARSWSDVALIVFCILPAAAFLAMTWKA